MNEIQHNKAWPFKYINGEQTPESKALEDDRDQHKPNPDNLDDMEEALL